MSLIDDALKRARDEAARQEEAHRREKRPWVPPPPKRSRRRAPVVVGAAIAAAALVAGVGLLLSRPPSPRVPAENPPRVSPPVAPPARDAAAGGSVAAAVPLPPVAETVEVSPPTEAKRGREPEASVRQTRPATPAPPPAAAPSSPVSAAPSITRGGAPPLRDGKTFVRVVDLPGGEKIDLEGIVYSETNPVAVIGGKVLSPGGFVGDFQIVGIEENRVTLRGRGVTIYVTLG